MTAATLEVYYAGTAKPEEFYFTHTEVVAGSVDQVIDDMNRHPLALMLCVRWHDHDFCEDPTACRGNEPSGDDFYFFNTKDSK